MNGEMPRLGSGWMDRALECARRERPLLVLVSLVLLYVFPEIGTKIAAHVRDQIRRLREAML